MCVLDHRLLYQFGDFILLDSISDSPASSTSKYSSSTLQALRFLYRFYSSSSGAEYGTGPICYIRLVSGKMSKLCCIYGLEFVWQLYYSGYYG